MAIQNLNNPSSEAIRVYWRIYGEVRKAHDEGWHKPYNNDFDDEGLSAAYEEGFYDAVDWLKKRAA